MSEQIEVPLREGSIRLGQLLKLSGVVESGAVAREAITAGVVRVDGAVVTQRGAQITPGQKVEFTGEEIGLPSVTLIPVKGS
ncbi:RNA-binding S4 domain-containing protein [Nesterenkonia alba]|uniref:RNA-binding S4 domain-containing protein n=1 Tax=Nesterenkonia alba TaxID=515814 RepID=UPI0003B327A4|nr:RNA-binding S4 domain-containing protein [Nesterenkonia alba]